ncbi:hypothetical protein ACN27G_09975 [Plantactinospora sp. WMMB334]|uniref:hypothetical protein n=1 Tax=Plantactinospora sp. WMMB334 TaxID=3404119 RepID=UPI003B93CD71
MTSGEVPRPGLAPGLHRPVGTMSAALYGELRPHPWRDPETAQDAYILFHDRSLAMGWLDDLGGTVRITAGGVEERPTGAPGLWGMNDAGQVHPLALPESSLVAWFQVGVEPVAGDRPLPVQPFLRCAADTVARIGELRLRAVQLLLPVQGIDASARPAYAELPALRTAGWFTGGDPRASTPVRVTLDGGQDPSIRTAAPRMRERMGRPAQEVFACGSLSLDDEPAGGDNPGGDDPLASRPPFEDHFWNGPARYRATFHGTLAEWSADALGWLGGLLADLAARHGITTPLLLTAARLEAEPTEARR